MSSFRLEPATAADAAGVAEVVVAVESSLYGPSAFSQADLEDEWSSLDLERNARVVRDGLDANALGLSGGQQQRLCIARALAVEPDVILMDEPCSALDPIATAKIEELIHELKTQYTIVIVTHNMQQAGRISDHTGFFYLGKLIEFGPTTKIFTKPSEKRTEDYITGRFG